MGVFNFTRTNPSPSDLDVRLKDLEAFKAWAGNTIAQLCDQVDALEASRPLKRPRRTYP